MPTKPTQFQARRFLAAAKDSAKRSNVAVSNIKIAVEEAKERLASLIEEKALGVYARRVSRN